MLLKYRSQGLNLKILDILPFKLLYNLFQVKFEVFCKYITNNLAKQFI